MAMKTIPLVSSITIFLMLMNLASASIDLLSFTFNDFNEDDKTKLILQGDAKIVPNVIQLTNTDQNSVGRVLYLAEMRLWEKSSAHKLANFQTRFCFSLSQGSGTPADGIAFFLAPADTTIPPGAVGNGGLLGLFGPDNAQNPSANQVVAVEFDTYTNDQWDPSYGSHIGINVNSIQSVNTVSWDRRDGEIVNVVVTYTAFTQTLAVVASYPDGQKYQLSSQIDLGKVLPEYVRVGFSAATGGEFQAHNLHSWSLTSTLVKL